MSEEPAPATEPFTVPRMTDDELRAFVRGFCDGQIFTSAQCRADEDLPMVFMPLALGALAGVPYDVIATIGCLYESLDKAGPRSINGMPSFFSFRVMHVEDWKRAVVAI